VLAVTRRQPWLFHSLVRQVLPPARPIDPAERIGLRIASVRTPEQVWRALDKALQAASRGEIAPAEAARIMRRIEARLRAERRRRAAAPAASRHAGPVDQGQGDQGQVDQGQVDLGLGRRSAENADDHPGITIRRDGSNPSGGPRTRARRSIARSDSHAPRRRPALPGASEARRS
jgi:hypothetical protein